MDSLIWFFCLRSDYPELMHPRSQGAGVEAQDRCGPVLSFDAPSGFGKNFKNLVSLGLFQGSHGGRCRHESCLRSVLGFDVGALFNY